MPQLRLLYVEGAPAVAEEAEALLMRMVPMPALTRVTSPEDCEAALEQGRHDVVILGTLPGAKIGTILELVRRGRAHLPVIVLAAALHPADALACLDAGAVDYISRTELWRAPHALRRAASHGRIGHPGWERLVEVVQDLALARGLGDVQEIVCHAARDLTGADGATLALLRGDEQCSFVHEDAIAPLWMGQRVPLRDCVSGWVIQHNEPLAIPDVFSDLRASPGVYKPTFVKSLAMVPIRGPAPVGAIGSYWADVRIPTDEEVALLMALADATAIAIENVAAFQLLARQVTDRVRDLEAVNRELEAFSYTVSHDLRAPVRAIAGFADLIATDPDDHLEERGQARLRYIQQSAKRMDEMIDALLTLAHLSKAPMERATVDISQLATEVLERIRIDDPERLVAVSVTPDLAIEGDPALLRIVLSNLLSNAWKYSARATRASISVSASADGHGFVVRDNGIGFDMKSAGRIFEPFQRLHTDEEFPGTGVGLSTVRRIVKRHGGDIAVESMPGLGTAVTITLGPEQMLTA